MSYKSNTKISKTQKLLKLFTIGGSRIFLEGCDFGNPSGQSERALRGSGLREKFERL